MGKSYYKPKKKRGRCVHIYRKSSMGIRKGEQCPRFGTTDRDGVFRCSKHRDSRFAQFMRGRLIKNAIQQINAKTALLASMGVPSLPQSLFAPSSPNLLDK